MAKERRSGHQAKIIKKEPTFAIASSIAEQEQDTPENWIAIDLAKALPGISITESMHIIIEGVPMAHVFRWAGTMATRPGRLSRGTFRN
jgi:hypothetical protein